MRLWGHESGACMQVLHFAYAFGAFLAPLIAKHFISEGSADSNGTESNSTTVESVEALCESLLNTTSNITSGIEISSYYEYINGTDCVELLHDICHNISLIVNYTVFNIEMENCSLHLNEIPEKVSDTSRFKFAYLISSSLFILPLLAFVYFGFRYEILTKSCCQKKQEEEQVSNEDSDSEFPHEQEKQPTSRRTIIYTTILFTLLFLFMFIYVGLEAGYGSLILTVAVTSELNFEKQQAAILQSLFWGTFAFTRLISVALVLIRVRSSVMICGNLSGSLLASIIMVFYPHNPTAIWIGTAVLGMSYASIFPTTMTWMSENAKATGKATAVLNTAGTVGDLTVPTAFGALIAQVSPDSLIYGTFVGVVVSICIIAALFLTACLQKRATKDVIGDRKLVRSNARYSKLEKEESNLTLNNNNGSIENIETIH